MQLTGVVQEVFFAKSENKTSKRANFVVLKIYCYSLVSGRKTLIPILLLCANSFY